MQFFFARHNQSSRNSPIHKKCSFFARHNKISRNSPIHNIFSFFARHNKISRNSPIHNRCSFFLQDTTKAVVILLSTRNAFVLQDTSRSDVIHLSTTDAVYFARHNIPIAIVWWVLCKYDKTWLIRIPTSPTRLDVKSDQIIRSVIETCISLVGDSIFSSVPLHKYTCLYQGLNAKGFYLSQRH